MKIGKIAGVFKKKKHLTVYTSQEGEQWISNGNAVYRMAGMPSLSPAMMLTIFDVPPEKNEEWTLDESELPSWIDFSYNNPSDRELKESHISVNWHGDTFAFMVKDGEILAVNTDFLKPLYDDEEYLYYFSRQTKSGGLVIVAKVAMEIKAIIMPMRIHGDEEFTNEMDGIVAKLAVKAAREARAVTEASEVKAKPEEGEE